MCVEGGGDKCDSASQEGEIGPVILFKSFRDNDHDGKGLCCWCSVNNDYAENDANDDDVGGRWVTAADDRDNGSNGKEDRVDDDEGGGDDWLDVNVDNDGCGILSLFPFLTPIIVESDRDRNGGGAPAEEEEEQASSLALMTNTTTTTTRT